MLFNSKTMYVSTKGDLKTINIADYSTIIDVNLREGPYNEHYCDLFYTTKDDKVKEGKVVNIICISDYMFNGTFSLDDKYKFLKSVVLGNGMVKTRYFFFIYEELSTEELRDSKISDIIS